MNHITVSCIVFACIAGGALFGMILRALLPEEHLNPESRDVIKLGMGLIGTMTALVLGLLIASAKGSFDTQRNGLAQLAGNVMFLDRALAHFGPEAKDARKMLRDSVTDMVQRTWPGESPQSSSSAPEETVGRYEGLFDKIEKLKPTNEAQKAAQAQARKTATDIAQARWLLFAEKGSSIPKPFLAVMVAWLALLLASFSLFAPRNHTVVLTLLVCALAVSSAIFLILELDQPYGGIIQVSSEPLRNALVQLAQ
jgi:hypothetical protein